MIPPKVSVPHKVNSPAENSVVLAPLTVGTKTLASIITPNVILIIPFTNGLAISNHPAI
jgi:hypothetical protein